MKGALLSKDEAELLKRLVNRPSLTYKELYGAGVPTREQRDAMMVMDRCTAYGYVSEIRAPIGSSYIETRYVLTEAGFEALTKMRGAGIDLNNMSDLDVALADIQTAVERARALLRGAK